MSANVTWECDGCGRKGMAKDVDTALINMWRHEDECDTACVDLVGEVGPTATVG